MPTKKPWAWLDTETTGLKPSDGARVIQVAVHVTDDSLRDITRGGKVVYASYIKVPLQALIDAAPRALEVNHVAKAVARAEIKQLPNTPTDRPRIACGPLALQPATDETLALPGSVFKTKEFPTGEHVYVMTDYEVYDRAPPPHVVWQTVHQMLSGCHLVCQNLPFDKPFVENELALCGLTYPCDFRGIEIMSLSNLLSQHLGLTAWGLDKLYDAMAARYGMDALSAHRADGDVARMMAVYSFVRKQFMASFVWQEAVKAHGEFVERLAEKLGAGLGPTWIDTAKNIEREIDTLRARVADLENDLSDKERQREYLAAQIFPTDP